MEFVILAITILAALFFGFRSYWTTAAIGAELVLISSFGSWSAAGLTIAWISFVIAALLMLKNPLRKRYLSRPILNLAQKVMPSISQTEQEALEAGSVSWESSFFAGKPDWHRLLNEKTTSLSEEEQAFLDGPVEEICEQLNDWEITHERYDLRQETWDKLGKEGFFGMIIPKEYGGLGFSHAAHSAVVMKLATRSISAAVTVMVPNSLGPAELLLQYGKQEQRDYYLPRLAKGEEIPCFALTGPLAGSDAGAIPDTGIVCKGKFDGKEVTGVKLNWNKRYITLAPVATVLGLAFKLYDPEKLLSDETDRGVSCALIPTNLPGINTGARHLPLNTVFMNGPTWGNDVFIPLDYLIGGEDYIGKGWTMLMNALSVGRSISLPALATGAGKLSSMTTGAYSRIREQFGLPVGEFEGVQEGLEQIAGLTYLMDSARQQVLHAVDNGEKPAIPSAILKYQNTEYMRKVVGHAMDVHAGRGVIKGPRNHIARVYQAIPISITVEGANILTRSMMIFGQGAIRCHPHLLKEMLAITDNDLGEFDSAFFSHLGQGLNSVTRAFLLGLADGYLTKSPVAGSHARYFRQTERFTAAYAFCVNLTFAVIGGDLKRKERISGRLADILIHLYYTAALLNRFERLGRPNQHELLVHWGAQYSLFRVQQALSHFIDNFPAVALRPLLKVVCFPIGRRCKMPDDKLGEQVARLILSPSTVRNDLIAGCYRNENPHDPVGRIEYSFKHWVATEPVREKLRDAYKNKEFEHNIKAINLLLEEQRAPYLTHAVSAGIISQQEADNLDGAALAVWDAIQVDHFDPADLVRNTDQKGAVTAPMDGPEVSPSH